MQGTGAQEKKVGFHFWTIKKNKSTEGFLAGLWIDYLHLWIGEWVCGVQLRGSWDLLSEIWLLPRNTCGNEDGRKWADSQYVFFWKWKWQSFPTLLVCSELLGQNTRDRIAYKQYKFIPHSFTDMKSKVRGPEGQVISLSGLQTSCCIHTWWKGQESSLESPFEGTNLMYKGSWPKCPPKVLPPNTIRHIGL